MRKKRRKSNWRPGQILWPLLIVNVALGLNYSKVTSIVHARAAGVPPQDQERVQGILESMANIPCAKVDARKLESEVMSNEEVDSVELSRHIFGSSWLKVRYRNPVATLKGRDGVVLSDDGMFYHASIIPSGLPVLDMPASGPPTLVTYAGTWQPGSIAMLAGYARQKYAGKDIRIEINPRGVVCLNIGSGRVILGSCDDLDKKLKTLDSRLQKNPQELDGENMLVLTLPSNPTIVPKAVEKKP